MSAHAGSKVFLGLYLVVLALAMWLISDGQLNVATVCSVPIVASSQGIVFVMVYATIFFGQAEGQKSH